MGGLHGAIEELHHYLARKASEIHDAEELVRRASAIHAELNPRQLALIHAQPESAREVEGATTVAELTSAATRVTNVSNVTSGVEAGAVTRRICARS